MQHIIKMDELKIEDIKGILYKIKCVPTQKIYIGQTLSHHKKNKKWEPYGLECRLQKHLDRSSFADYPLYNDIKKYGLDAFEIKEEIILDSKDIDRLNELEKELIYKYDCLHPHGYNLTTNTNNMSDDKKLLYDYYGKNIERTEEYLERQQRRKQISVNCNTDRKRKSFFDEKDVESIYISAVKEGNQYRIIRVLVYVKDFEDVYRLQFTNKDIQQSIERALTFSKSLTNNIKLNSVIENIKNNNVEELYQYQEKLDEVLKYKDNLKRISGSFQFHKKINKHVYLIIIYYKNLEDIKSKRVMFGGKNISEDDAKKYGLEFIQKIKNILSNEEEVAFQIKTQISSHQQ